jgi:plasmid stabilization system protein ParE
LAKVVYSEGAFSDLDRLIDFLLDAEAPQAARVANLITEAVGILANHPLIGRNVEENLRELVISRGKSAYLALYSYEEAYDAVFILAIRHSREAGYSRDDLKG